MRKYCQHCDERNPTEQTGAFLYCARCGASVAVAGDWTDPAGY